MFNHFSIVFVTFASMLIAGCQGQGASSRHADASTRPASASATVTCSQCNASWAQSSMVNDKGVRVPRQTAQPAAVCPTCVQAAQGAFESGATVRCKSCDGKMQVAQFAPVQH